jgi:dephospho-CoA kinase
MLTLRKIAITGGLAAGKTSVCLILRSLGAHVISADGIVHRLLSPSSELYDRVVGLLGSNIVNEQRIDRAKVARIVFRDPVKLQQLEELLHPAVRKEIELDYRQIQKNNPPLLFVAEIPLLFESSSEDFFDAVVAVMAPEKLCRARFASASGHGDEEFFVRTNRQLPADIKAHKADFIIVNDGTLAALEQKVKVLYETLVNM